MAVKTEAEQGTEMYTLTATENVDLGTAAATSVGSVDIQVSGLTAGGGNIVPQTSLFGAAGQSVSPVATAYHNDQTGADVASGTAITADGLYKIPADNGRMVRLAYTHSSGTVKVLVRRGVA